MSCNIETRDLRDSRQVEVHDKHALSQIELFLGVLS